MACDKDSLCVKLVNNVNLKERSVWEINEDSNDSWGWRNLLKIREEVKEFCVMKIGNGCKASAWYDNWSQHGALSSFITLGIYTMQG